MNVLIGNVTQIDETKGTLKVVFQSKGNRVSNWLPVVTSCLSLPKVNDTVCVVYTDTNIGICLGSFFNANISLKSPLEIKREIVSSESITTLKDITAVSITGNITGGGGT